MDKHFNCEMKGIFGQWILNPSPHPPPALTFMMGVMNSSKKLCLRRDGQL